MLLAYLFHLLHADRRPGRSAAAKWAAVGYLCWIALVCASVSPLAVAPIRRPPTDIALQTGASAAAERPERPASHFLPPLHFRWYVDELSRTLTNAFSVRPALYASAADDAVRPRSHRAANGRRGGPTVRVPNTSHGTANSD